MIDLEYHRRLAILASQDDRIQESESIHELVNEIERLRKMKPEPENEILREKLRSMTANELFSLPYRGQ